MRVAFVSLATSHSGIMDQYRRSFYHFSGAQFNSFSRSRQLVHG